MLGTLNKLSLVGINPENGEFVTRAGSVLLPARLDLQGPGSAFSAKSRTLTLLMAEPPPAHDWSGGDPRALVVLELPLPLKPGERRLPQAVDVKGGMEECDAEADLRFMDPTLTYIEWPSSP